jgi:hypothetical protein
MTEIDNDDQPADDDVEQPAHHPVLPEVWQQVFALIELCSDPRGFKKKLQGLHRALTAVDEGMARLAADRTAHDAQLAKDRAELAAERDVLMKRRVAVQQAERSLEERRETVLKMERAWSGLTLPGEPPPLAGTLSRAYSGLERARYAAEHGGALPTHPDAEPDQSSSSVNYDPSGAEFPKHVTITRQPAETDAPAGARIHARGRKSAPEPGPGAA